MRILLSGSSGFVGSALLSYFQAKGYEVERLVRKGQGIIWNPEKGILPKDRLEGFDAVIHLAGESVFGRWTEKKKKNILLSRKAGTLLLAHALSELSHPPKVFISASAVGFYGDRGEELLTEESHEGKGFLSHVCQDWEKGARSSTGIRTVQTRFGLVIGPGGVVKQTLFPFRLGLGGPLGSGKQWVSWIALEDLMQGMDHVLHHPYVHGAVNFVSPHPVRQEEFASALASVLHRPSKLRIPAFVLKLIFGQMGEELLLSSTRAVPKKLLHSHFRFTFAEIRDALQKAVE